MNIRRMTAGWSEPGPTAVLEHGANPGLISHWTKQGLIDIAERLLDDKKVAGRRRRGNPPTGQGPDLQSPGHEARREGDPLQRARHANHRPAQAGRRVRQHLEHRGLPRGGHHHGRDGLGNARKATAARWPTNMPTGRATKSAWRGWASTPGSSPGCRTTASAA